MGEAHSVASDPYALTRAGGFPFVRDQAARDRAYSLMQQAERRSEELGYDDEQVEALMNDALEYEIQAIEFTGEAEQDFIQVQDLMYLFGHRMIGEHQSPFERHGEQRLLDMLEEILEETEVAAHADISRGLTSQSGTYKSDLAEQHIQRAKLGEDNKNKIRLLLQSIQNIEDMQNKLENE